MTKEDTLLLLQIDGQTNWNKEKSDLNGSRIGEYMGTVKKGLPHGQGQLCYSHGGKYIGSWKDGKRDGLLKIYYENEQLSKVLNWEEDKLISKKCWDENGNKIECE